MRFPKPWTIEQTGPTDCVVCDASGRKLFYIVGDEGDGDEEQPSVLFWGNAAESDAVLSVVKEMVEKVSYINSQVLNDEWQDWTDEVQKIVCEFVQNDSDLGERMLDHSEPFWEECREAGLTPHQALDKAIEIMSNSRC